jgi:hypothetical protein
MISSLELQSLVDAARETGESVVVTVLPDGTVVEVHFQPKPPTEQEPTKN